MVFVGDDWAKDHHDVELVDDNGRRLARARLPEGMDGVSRLHALIAEHAPPEWADLDPDEVAARVRVGIETDRVRGCRLWSWPATGCIRSTRCRWPATGNDTRRPGPSPTPVTPTSSPRSCA